MAGVISTNNGNLRGANRSTKLSSSMQYIDDKRRWELMVKQLKYEKPKVINFSSTEWEIGAGICEGGSGVTDPTRANCINGPSADPNCSSGNTQP